MLTFLHLVSLHLATAQDIVGDGASAACSGGTCGVGSVGSLFKSISTILLYLIGAISIVMIIVGGLRYVLSAGDSKNTAAAKDTILYAVIGLVIALSAGAIIKFVLGGVK
jgi:hypothetical protein